MKALTPKQAMFLAEYLVDGNATRAAVASGVPEASAHVTGSRWLKDRRIAALIAERQARRVEKLDLTGERVLLELKRMALYDPGRLYDETGKRIPVHLLDEDTRRAVAWVEDETQESRGEPGEDGIAPLIVTRRQKIKMTDKRGAAELLGKHLKLWEPGEFSASMTTGAAGLAPNTGITVTFVRPE